jgi:hypothetical protein
VRRLLPWLSGDCDDESELAVLIPKSPKPHLRVMPRNCGNPDCWTCQQQTDTAEVNQ